MQKINKRRETSTRVQHSVGVKMNVIGVRSWLTKCESECQAHTQSGAGSFSINVPSIDGK